MVSLPQFMKALVKDSPVESYVYKDVPVPQPSQGELLVKVKKVALCGTDIQKYKWNDGKNSLRLMKPQSFASCESSS